MRTWTWRSAARAVSSGSALSASLRADGHRVLRFARGGITGDDDDRLGPGSGPHRRAGARRCRRGRAPRGRGHRREALDRRAEAAHPRQSRARHRGARRRDREPGAQAAGVRVGVGDRLLRQPRRRDPHRGEPARRRLPRRGVRGVGSARPGPRPTRACAPCIVRTGIVLDAHGGALAADAAPVQARARRQSGLGQAVDELDHARRRDRARSGTRSTTTTCAARSTCVAPNPVTNAEFAATLGKVLHRPTVLPTPMFPVKVRFGAELVEALLLGSQRVAPAALAGDRATSSRTPTLEPALRSCAGPGLSRDDRG